MTKIVTALAFGLPLFVGLAAGQQPSSSQSPTFRVGVDAVQIDVSVLDKERRPVRGLTAADFTVLEDGQPRPIVAFSAVDLGALPSAPVTALDAVPPDINTNDLPDGRILVILMDPFLERVVVLGRRSIADFPGRAAALATGMRLIDGLGPGDLAAVVHTRFGVAQNLTSDRARLRAAIRSSAIGTAKAPDGEERGDCVCGLCRVEAITEIADALRDEPLRKKTIIFVGERLQLSPVDGPCERYLGPATRRMVQAAQLANVTVHTVDPNGLETTNVRAGDDFDPLYGVTGPKRQEEANRAHLIERQQSLQAVAHFTGGRAVMNTNAPENSVLAILDESSAYYVLAFQSGYSTRDGRFHSIDVTVNRPDAQVRTRKGYYAEVTTAEKASHEGTISLEAISRGLLAQRGLPLTVAASPFRGPRGSSTVVIATGVKGLTENVPRMTREGDRSTNFEPIHILTSAFPEDGKDVEWHQQRFAAALPNVLPGQLWYEAISTLNLKPGKYEVRVAARHEHGAVVGSVHTYVDVPDFDNTPLTLSGVLLIDAHAPTATPVEALRGLVDAAPTTRREFTAVDQVAAFVRMYQRRRSEPTAATIVFRILDHELHEVAAATHDVGPDQLGRDRAADVRFRLPLETLQPGSYLLRVYATAAGHASQRDVRFVVK